MNDSALAAIAGGFVVAGLTLAVASMLSIEVWPTPPARPGRRTTAWLRSRRAWATIGFGSVAGVAAWAVTGWPVAGIAVVAGTLALPRLVGRRAAQRRIARLDALETWTRNLVDVLIAGRGLEDALVAAADDPPAAIHAEVVGLRRRLEMRTPTEEALRDFADEVGHPVADMIAAALLIASQVRGRGLRDVLAELATTVARDTALAREIDAERATHRTTTIWVMFALAAYTVFAVINRNYVAPFADPTGQLVLGIVVVLYGGTLWWLHRLATPRPAHRFLPNPADASNGRRR